MHISSEVKIPASLLFLLAFATGAVVANLYYSQPLIDPIAQALNIPLQLAGFIVTLTQVGYGVGLIFIVPLADRHENRKLIVTLMFVAALCLFASAFIQSASLFLLLAFGIGLCSVAAQVMVPLSSHLAPEEIRGRVVGQVMSGLMLGIMLARPVASFVTEMFSWQVVFLLSGGLMLVLAAAINIYLPKRDPETKPTYPELLKTMVTLIKGEPQLRRRGLYQAAMFGCFSLFWTTVPLLLLSPRFGFNQAHLALFALAGVAGAISAPIAGGLADKGLGAKGTTLAMAGAICAFGLACAPLVFNLSWGFGILTLVCAAVLLDFCVTANLVFGQRIIYSLKPNLRSRLNGLFMATFFAGGAVSSALGGWLYYHFNWTSVCAVGAFLPLMALCYFFTE